MFPLKNIGAVTTGVDVTAVTTAETLALYSGLVSTPWDTSRVFILGWFQFTSGAAVTALTPRIRRGNGITGILVGDAVVEQLFVAAGSTEHRMILVSEERQNTDSVDYSLTVQQTAGAANGTVLQSGVIVFVL